MQRHRGWGSCHPWSRTVEGHGGLLDFAGPLRKPDGDGADQEVQRGLRGADGVGRDGASGGAASERQVAVGGGTAGRAGRP